MFARMPTTPTILRWERLTSTAFDAIDRSRAVVLVSCSPIEVHGPHLPLGTDAFEAEALLARTVRALPAPHGERTFIQVPTIFAGTDTLPQAGSLFFRASTIVAVLEDLGRTLAAQGFRDIWVSNFHGSPRHFLAIEEACARVSRRAGARMASIFSLMLGRLLDGRPDASLDAAVADLLEGIPGVARADLIGDSHAGFIETAQMLAIEPTLVEARFRELARVTVEGWLAEQGGAAEAKGEGKGAFVREIVRSVRFFKSQTYAGAPARATAEAGERILDAFAGRCAAACAELLEGTLAPSACHSPLWRLRFLFLNSVMIEVGDRLVGHAPVR
jgi:creatinine amidohydrolase